MTNGRDVDVIIVGAGPIGLFAVFACGQLGMRCHVIDALSEPGGQCTALYPEKPIFDIPGFPSIGAAELISRLMKQAEPYQPTFSYNALTSGLFRHDHRFSVMVSTGEEIRGGAIIVAAGAGAFRPNRPPLAGIEALEGDSVHYWVKDPELLRDRHVVIAGGGDSAVDWAVLLSEISASVTVVHRRNKFRAAPASLATLSRLCDSRKVILRVPYQLSSLVVSGTQLNAIEIEDLDGKCDSITADILLPFFGLASDLGALADFGLAINGTTIPVDPLTAATAQPGIFAIGDIAGYAFKEKLLVTGFAEAMTAARSAFAYAFPEKPYHFQHSTDRGAPLSPP